ncbi:ABC transporter permease [Oceanirhabdus sp. W0125-5]|uniref:ABC transporter permease n=1 Tax=Oceanirhabdus sp. W0125-5 TaxID=2999116 RepID=UPI0022F2CD35|nr:ABC transporter permease [Oceanirhabdus sp. W0125-5]WBW98933.1 ABC transporter permease [Oceanirhabdus sp. W0125-5]
MKIILMALNSLKIAFRAKVSIFKYIIIPVLSVYMLIGLGTKDPESGLRVKILDNDRTYLSQLYIDELVENNNIDVYTGEGDTTQLLTSNKIDISLEIHEGFQENTFKGGSPNIVITSIQGSETSVWIKAYSNNLIESFKSLSKISKEDEETFKSLYDEYKKEKITVEGGWLNRKEDLARWTAFAMGMLIMFIMYNCIGNTERILRDKRNKTYYRIRTAPVNSFEYIMGNVLFNIIILTIQLCLVLLVVFKIQKADLQIEPWILFAAIMSFGLSAIGIGMTCVAFAKRNSFGGLITPIIVTPTCMLSGCFFPVDVMPDFMKKISYFFPQRWALNAIKTAQLGGDNIDVFISILVTLGFAAVFFLIASLKMRKSKAIQFF